MNMRCYILLYNNMGEEVEAIGTECKYLCEGDIVRRKSIDYEVHKKLFQTADNCLYIKAFQTLNN